MENPFIYRQAAADDTDQLMHVSQQSFGQYKPQLSEEGWMQLNSNLQDKQRLAALADKSEVFVCADGSNIIGMAFLVPSGNGDDIYDDAWCHLRMVGVLPEYTGRGIARRLTEMCVERAKKNGETTMALHTSEMMNVARHIYESMGFSVVKEITPRFGKRYWLFTMTL